MYIIIYSFIIGCVYEICDQMFQDHIQKPFRHASRNCNSVDLGFEVCEVLEMSYSFVTEGIWIAGTYVSQCVAKLRRVEVFSEIWSAGDPEAGFSCYLETLVLNILIL